MIEADQEQSIVSGDSDLVPGRYEGGLKTWECSIDLVQYLHESNADFKNKRIFEVSVSRDRDLDAYFTGRSVAGLAFHPSMHTDKYFSNQEARVVYYTSKITTCKPFNWSLSQISF